jgi:hypothetical protein
MWTADDRTKVASIGDRLIDLYIRRAEACGQEDWHRVRRLESAIKAQAVPPHHSTGRL